MSVIYRPKGMAREYSPYALNIYIGCSHRCKYCYAPYTLQRRGDEYFGKPEPRKNILIELEKDLKKNVYTEQVLLSLSVGTFIPNKNAKPHIGKTNRLEYVEEEKLEAVCDLSKVNI